MKLLAYIMIVAICACGGDATVEPNLDASEEVDAARDIDAPLLPSDTEIVVTGGGQAEPDISVVVHDQDGLPLQTLLTDSDGVARFALGDGAIVTVVGVDLFSIYDVAVGDVLRVDIGYGDPQDGPSLHNIVLPEAAPNGEFYRMTNGCDVNANPQWDAGFPLETTSACTNEADTFHTIVWSTNSPENQIQAFSWLKNISRDLTTVTMPAWTTDFFEFTWTSSHFGDHSAFRAAHVVDGIAYEAPHLTGNTASQQFQVAEGFAELIQYSGLIRVGEPTPAFNYPSKLFFGKRLPVSVQSDHIDVPSHLLPAVTGVAVDNTDPARARLGWTTEQPVTNSDGILVRTRWITPTGGYTWAVSVPPSVAEVRLPELPDDFAQYIPSVPVADPYVVVVETTDFDDRKSFREGGMALINGPRFLKNQVSFVRGSVYFPSF